MKKRPALTASLIGLVAGIAFPFIELAIACWKPTSEACVWGKAFLPLTLAIEIPVVGCVAAGIAYAFIAPRKRRPKT